MLLESRSLDLIPAAGLKIVRSRRTGLGIFHVIEAIPM
jgi:hypothetical protein